MTRTRPWRQDNPDAVIVARPSRWGNRWRVTSWQPSPGERLWSVWDVGSGETQSQHPTKVQAIAAAVAYFRADIGDLDLTALRGRDLACWCPLDQPCHADVLLEIANA